MTQGTKINAGRAANEDSQLEIIFRPTVAIHGYLAEMAEMGIFGGPTPDDVARELVYMGVRSMIRQGWFEGEIDGE